MKWILFGLIVLLAGAALWRFLKQPVAHGRVPLSDLPRFVRGMVTQMAPGGFLIAENEREPGFIQFALSRSSASWGEVELGVPDLTWSQAAFDPIHEDLKAAGFAPTIEQDEDGLRFLRVRAVGDLDAVGAAALRMARIVSDRQGWSDPQFTVRMTGPLRVPTHGA